MGKEGREGEGEITGKVCVILNWFSIIIAQVSLKYESSYKYICTVYTQTIPYHTKQCYSEPNCSEIHYEMYIYLDEFNFGH